MAGPSPISILAADDHPLIQAGPVNFLATEPELHVVAEAANGEEALEKYRELRPDIVLMDLSMPVRTASLRPESSTSSC
jgi:two-component system, NarL family, response regulator